MHKIKKGIKKKIKGKKGKNDEIFTEEELEQYKKEKADEARRLTEEHQSEHPTDDQSDAEHSYEHSEAYGGLTEKDTSSSQPATDNSDWKNFLASTDTVLKKTSDNLEHIKESSYVHSKKHNDNERGGRVEDHFADPYLQKPSATASPVVEVQPKSWANLETGIDDETDGEKAVDAPEPFPESAPKKIFVELKPIEDLPEVSAEDYADVFDTAFVDNIDSGDLHLIIPDSPDDDYSNEPDPFDTSVADRVLHIEEPKPDPEPKLISGTKVKSNEPSKKRKIQLVSLGNAVDVLTGKSHPKAKEVEESDQIDLLGDFTQESDKKRTGSSGSDIEKDKTDKQDTDKSDNQYSDKSDKENSDKQEHSNKEKCEQKESSAIDDILFNVDEPLDELPEIGVPIVNDKQTCEDTKEDKSCVSEFDELLGAGQEKDEPIDYKDLLSEFDVIDNVTAVDDESLVPKLVDDPILDEFDAEFASLAHECVAKAKDKEIDEIGLDDEDDPFDTSHVTQIIKDQTEECIVLAVGNSSTKAQPPPRPAAPPSSNLDILSGDAVDDDIDDPFDTTFVQNISPVDHLETTVNDADFAETLEPYLEKNLTKSDSFDPFDTSAADSFGITELKVLENELLKKKTDEEESNLDFDFNPRDEEDTKVEFSAPTVCLLSTDDANNVEAVLEIQQPKSEEELDPFDTSIADKIQIQALEAELLGKVPDAQYPPKETIKVKSQPPPRPTSPVCLLAKSPDAEDNNIALQPQTTDNKDIIDDDIDPFDTSIAEAYGISELKAFESELLENNISSNIETIITNNVPIVKKDCLELKIKPARPSSPVCLLGATPLDENPTLIPQTKSQEQEIEEDFDPFDTSIAQQFGRTELHVLESELLAASPSQVSETDDFDPRAVSPVLSKPQKPALPPKPTLPPKPACLLAAIEDTEAPADLPLAPSEISNDKDVEDFDPFDTSIADHFGTTELKHLEDILLSKPITADGIQQDTVEPNNLTILKDLERTQNTKQLCLLATTPTDSKKPLEPFSQSEKPETKGDKEDFDPFDTSIANQFGKTEIKELEQSLLAEVNTPIEPTYNIPKLPKSTVNPEIEIDPFDTSFAETTHSDRKQATSDDDFNPRDDDLKGTSSEVDPIDLLDSAGDSTLPDKSISILQPQEAADLSLSEDIDPFDTSIAASILPGKTELKLLESELLTK
uniref:Protein stoned-A-like n=3 Tax=Hirondellea gigas TaxID=1518452 RepID=A0A6A7FMS0_9CRUS